MPLRSAPFLLAVFAAAAAPMAFGQGETLRVHGSNTVGEHLAPALIAGWAERRGLGAVAVDQLGDGERLLRAGNGRLAVELHSHGSNTGMRDLLEGRTDIAMSSRAVFADEVKIAQAQGLGRLDAPAQEFVIALDGLAIIVHPRNPVAALELDTVRRVFAGELGNWSQLGGRDQPIRVLARDDKSGTFETFRMLVLGQSRLGTRVERYESTDQLAREVAADGAAIGFVGLGGVGEAKALAIRDADTRPLSPDVTAVAVEDYLLTRRLYLYLRSDASALARAFAEFAVSDAAQPAVERSGFVAQTIRAVPLQPAAGAPEDYRGLLADAERLSLNFRFGTGSSVLDSRAARDLDRLAAYLGRDGGGRRVLLFGFADASEVLPYLAISLANDRVDYIAGQLTARGIAVGSARGVGGNLPVASNRSEWGRHKNRRVEVWLAPPAG